MLKSKKPLCEFGENCYRLNKEHLLEQSHPHLEAIMMSYKKHGVIRVPQHFQVPGIIEKQIRDLLNLKDSKYSTQGDVKYKGQKSKHSDETPSSSNSEDEMKIPKCTKSEMCKSLKVAHLQSNLHPHLEDILLKYRGFGSYNIPTHLQNDKIEEQLNIMIDNEIQHSLSEPNTGPGGKDQSASGPSGKGKKAKEKMSGSGTQNLKTGFAKKQSEVLSSSENEDDSDSSKPKASGPAKKGKPKVSKESFSSREGKRNEIDCKYASDCSMTNVEHFKRYEHEHLENLLWKFKVRGPSSIPKHMDKGLVAKQLELMSSFGQEDDLDSDSSKPKSSESAGKRKNKASKESSSSREDDHSGTTCRDGVKCKSENIRHLQKFEHPHLENLLWSYKNNGESCIPKNLKTNHFIKKQLEMMAYSDEEDDGYFNVKKTTTYNVGGNKTKQTTSTYSYGRSSKEDEEVPSTACQYGVKCSRKDETHFRNYAHPHLEMVLLKYKESGEMEIPAYVRENKAIADQLELLVNIHEIKVNKENEQSSGRVASGSEDVECTNPSGKRGREKTTRSLSSNRSRSRSQGTVGLGSGAKLSYSSVLNKEKECRSSTNWECHLGEFCRDTDVKHFKIYSHQHLNKIISTYKGRGSYNIPPQYKEHADIFELQLDILANPEFRPNQDTAEVTSQEKRSIISAPRILRGQSPGHARPVSANKGNSKEIKAECKYHQHCKSKNPDHYLKYSHIIGEGNTTKKSKTECNYGENCYRKNPDHFRDYAHPHLEKILLDYRGHGPFDIPNNLEFQKQIIEQQLTLMIDNNLYSTRGGTLSANEDSKDIRPTKEKMMQSSAVVDTSDRKNVATSKRDIQNTLAGDQSTSRDRPVPEKANCLVNQPSPKLPKTETSQQSDSSNNDKKKIEDFFTVVAPKGQMAEKHRLAAPYYMFFTTITSAPQTHTQPLSITFQEILDPSLGILQNSLQINFMVDLGWLLAHYYFAGYNNKPLTILYGEDSEDLRTINTKKPNVKAHLVPMKNAFGKHHTKMALLVYEDGSVRVAVSTANLYMDDWENRTQGLWLSPSCPKLSDQSDLQKGESPTGFKRSLISYLSSYSMACLSPYIEHARQADFSAINVFLVASVPGGHTDSQWGLARVGSLLGKYCELPAGEEGAWDLVIQASSIGSYGKEPKLWLTGDFQSRMCRSSTAAPLQARRPALRFIYPSLKAVKHSHDNLLGGGCLPYSNSVHVKQTWLNGFLHEWNARHSGRQHAMPHIKSYLRLSPDGAMAAYFLLTSANVSKSAWGVFNKGNGALRINSYEVGVLFIPTFVTKQKYFSIMLSDPDRLPVPYDLPPAPYTSDKVPWVFEYLHQ